jgi:hypothetical protein
MGKITKLDVFIIESLTFDQNSGLDRKTEK